MISVILGDEGENITFSKILNGPRNQGKILSL